MKKLLFIFLVFAANVAFAQRTVTGLIIDKNNNPIENVKVSVKNATVETFTDAAGRYSIEVPQDKNTLEFSIENFRVQVVEITDDVINQTMTSIGDVDLFDLSLEELLNVQISVVSKTKQNVREAPGIVTVITKDDIKKNQCRDLVDALNMVPGFNIAKDLDEISLLVRGLYGFEGRALFLVDGMQLSSLYFGEYIIGNDFPIHMVEKIEIIRGPGSVVYGGVAELAVINIITTSGEQTKGVNVAIRYGQLPTKTGHKDVGINFGNKKGNIMYSGLAFFSRALKSDGIHSRFGWRPSMDHTEESAGTGNTAFLFKSQYYNTLNLNAYYQEFYGNYSGNFNLSEPYPDNLAYVIDSANSSYLSANKVRFLNYGFEINNQFHLTEYLSITPKFTYHYNESLEQKYRDDPAISRYKGILDVNWLTDNFKIICGVEGSWDYAKILRDPIYPGTYVFRKSLDDIEGSDNTTIMNVAGYASASVNFSDFYLIAGFRYDNNEIYGGKFNPRAGLTYRKEKFHTKLLFSSAFKAPLIANNALSKYGLDPSQPWRREVKPEDTKVYEYETGYQFSPNFYAALNVFYQEVNNIIEFRYNAIEGYLYSDNGGKIATYGVEMETKYISSIYNGTFNISYVKPRFFDYPDNQANIDALFGDGVRKAKGGDTYIAVHDPERLMGVPDFKIFNTNIFKINSDFSVKLDFLFLTKKAAMNDWESTHDIDPQLITGLGLMFDNVVEGLDISFSIHDLFNERLELVTPFYDGGLDNVNYKGREISIDLRYKLGKSK